ncbi:MAG TPA: hypothetical protein VK886_08005 [Vicinamibacterales bacterium]|nr:hypothetical protein [Vicinamibacterales bacterium]
MSADERRAGDRDKEANGERRKKPYRKPAFEHERAFETMALACGKHNPTQGQCRLVRKVS